MFSKNTIIFTEKEINRIKKLNSSKFNPLLYSIFLLFTIMILVRGIQKFIIAQKYAQLAHKSMSEIFNVINRGFSPLETYNGSYCIAIFNYMEGSINSFCYTIIMLGGLVFYCNLSKRKYKDDKLY